MHMREKREREKRENCLEHSQETFLEHQVSAQIDVLYDL